MAKILFHDPHHQGQNPTHIWRYVPCRDQFPPQCKSQLIFEITQFLINLLLTQLIGTIITYMVVMVQSGEALLKVDQKNKTLPLTDKKRPDESRSTFRNKYPYFLFSELNMNHLRSLKQYNTRSSALFSTTYNSFSEIHSTVISK